MQQPNDHSRFIAITNGDKTAFDNLFNSYYQRLCRFALTVVSSEDIAEDVVQNTFIKLWEKRTHFSEVKNVKAYLFRSVYLESIKQLKKTKHNKTVESNYLLVEDESWHDNKQEKWLEFKPKIELAIDNLPVKCRQIFLMKRQEGLTNSEIANYLGISIKTVETQTSLALLRLREELKPIIKHLPLLLTFINKFN